MSCFLKMTFESLQVCFAYFLPVMNVLSHVPKDYLKSLLIYRLTPSRKSHSFPPIKGTSKTKINIMCGRISQRAKFKVKPENFREKICKVYKKITEREKNGLIKSMPRQEINLDIFYLSLSTPLFKLNFNGFELFVFTTSKAVSYRRRKWGEIGVGLQEIH